MSGRVPTRLGACLALALVAAGCQGLRPTQRVPGAMRSRAADELPAPRPAPGEGPVAILVRHADPVEVRAPGALDGFPVRFWRKTLRVGPGTEVSTRAGGRVELTWEGDATTVVLSDNGTAVVGDPAAGQPLVDLREVTHARLSLTPEDRIQLPGGAELFGDDELPAGPFVVTRPGPELLRLQNQSSRAGLLRFRSATLELGPGESIDLPLLGIGSAPAPSGKEPAVLTRGGLVLSVTGAVETGEAERTASVQALEEVTLEALGVRVELAQGERATLSSMQRRTPAEAAPAGGVRTAPPISASAPN